MVNINTNVQGLNAHRSMLVAGRRTAQASMRMSTGSKLNSAADDSAGLSIDRKMRAQITGLDRAAANSRDGISLIQTADGGLAALNEILERVRELHLQAANDTLVETDKDQILQEISANMAEITRIVADVEFNTLPLLGGSLPPWIVGGTGRPVPGLPGLPDPTLSDLISVLLPGFGVAGGYEYGDRTNVSGPWVLDNIPGITNINVTPEQAAIMNRDAIINWVQDAMLLQGGSFPHPWEFCAFHAKDVLDNLPPMLTFEDIERFVNSDDPIRGFPAIFKELPQDPNSDFYTGLGNHFNNIYGAGPGGPDFNASHLPGLSEIRDIVFEEIRVFNQDRVIEWLRGIADSGGLPAGWYLRDYRHAAPPDRPHPNPPGDGFFWEEVIRNQANFHNPNDILVNFINNNNIQFRSMFGFDLDAAADDILDNVLGWPAINESLPEFSFSNPNQMTINYNREKFIETIRELMPLSPPGVVPPWEASLRSLPASTWDLSNPANHAAFGTTMANFLAGIGLSGADIGATGVSSTWAQQLISDGVLGDNTTLLSDPNRIINLNQRVVGRWFNDVRARTQLPTDDPNRINLPDGWSFTNANFNNITSGSNFNNPGHSPMNPPVPPSNWVGDSGIFQNHDRGPNQIHNDRGTIDQWIRNGLSGVAPGNSFVPALLGFNPDNIDIVARLDPPPDTIQLRNAQVEASDRHREWIEHWLQGNLPPSFWSPATWQRIPERRPKDHPDFNTSPYGPIPENTLGFINPHPVPPPPISPPYNTSNPDLSSSGHYLHFGPPHSTRDPVWPSRPGVQWGEHYLHNWTFHPGNIPDAFFGNGGLHDTDMVFNWINNWLFNSDRATEGDDLPAEGPGAGGTQGNVFHFTPTPRRDFDDLRRLDLGWINAYETLYNTGPSDPPNGRPDHLTGLTLMVGTPPDATMRIWDSPAPMHWHTNNTSRRFAQDGPRDAAQINRDAIIDWLHTGPPPPGLIPMLPGSGWAVDLSRVPGIYDPNHTNPPNWFGGQDGIRDWINSPDFDSIFIDLFNFPRTPFSMELQVGANAMQRLPVVILPMDLISMGLGRYERNFIEFVREGDSQGLSNLIPTVDAAIQRVAEARSTLGAIQNRVEHSVINTVTTASNNLSEARSRIESTDMAEEAINKARAVLIHEAAMNMMAQSNMQPAMILNLLA